MSKGALNRHTRGIAHFIQLKDDFTNNKERLLNSLPTFIRIMFLDSNPWIKKINSHDFILQVEVHSKFGLKTRQFSKFKFCDQIKPDRGDSQSIKISPFLNASIVTYQNHEFSVQDFCLALGYNGALHMESEDNWYTLIYDSFMSKHESITINIVDQIAQILITLFDTFLSSISEKAFGFSYLNFGPRLTDKNGKFLGALLYRDSFMQIGVNAIKKSGIRICCDLKLLQENNKHETIFSLGHSSKPEQLSISLSRNGSVLIYSCRLNRSSTQIKIPISEDYYENLQYLEFSIYPSGDIVIAENFRLIKHEKFHGQISISNCKMVIGADLNARKFGTFYSTKLIMHSVSQNGTLKRIWTSSLKREAGSDYRLPYNILKRPFLFPN
ncbi:hypothetical protein BXY85_0992 [Roseivirga pacifica]|uniref:Uncharacterized protein n=1 Tax=Roseivirga pacifica TaxID=1267423 RepID=A0A1I0RPE0_9BACT|nr:hypothetical protein [Roseivirga pacifica]RKQ49989.1 hypothetical protein BXY85_0992 [Roseivirga pacifica]SEW43170.1 hypothetical protein SAMN05216290_3940 [Roseivirga pacifica]